jgi:glycosyltransferase involved in cell wall biosynthesis
LLWFGRIDLNHKGLDLLLTALAAVPDVSRPHLRLAGYDHNGELARLHDLVDSLDIKEWVHVEGPILGRAKDDALASSRAYLHPSRWECHSIALLEALASGIPVFVGAGAHIAPVLAETAGGVVVAATPEAWADCLASLASAAPVAQDRRRLWRELEWPRSIAIVKRVYERAALSVSGLEEIEQSIR